MSYLPCLVCGRLSKASRCPEHNTRQARGYDDEYEKVRAAAIQAHPICDGCGHTALFKGGRCNNPACKKCPLQLDHRIPLRVLRRTGGKPMYQVLCRECNRAKSGTYEHRG